MRDPDRIPRVLQRLRETWETDPDLRLGQLLVSATTGVNLFYLEDEDLEERLVLENRGTLPVRDQEWACVRVDRVRDAWRGLAEELRMSMGAVPDDLKVRIQTLLMAVEDVL